MIDAISHHMSEAIKTVAALTAVATIAAKSS